VVSFNLASIAIPFASGYAPFMTSLGIVAGWGMAALGLSYYARGRIGPKRWRSLHRLTALVWLLGLVHSLGEGTDSGRAWFLVMAGAVVVPALLLLALRLLEDEGSSGSPPARSPQPPRAPGARALAD
jgi:sulfoxide reductase heme-binding subunit YedZ